MLLLALVLALFWGGIWALFLQMHPWGQFLAYRRTWITVVVGVGVDLLLMLLVLDLIVWLQVFAIIAVSSVGIIARSLHNELLEARGILDDIKRSQDR